MRTLKFTVNQFFLIWLINPFVAAILLFRNFRNISNIGPYLLISFFFGLSFVIPDGTLTDSIHYAAELKELNESQVSFSDFTKGLYSSEGEKLDIYQPLFTWLISRFTGNYKWLFGFFALVFGCFWFKNILFLRSQLPVKLEALQLSIFVFFILINPIWQINGVRMWTAEQILFYGILLVQFRNLKYGYLFLVLPLFVHFSMFIPLSIFLLFKLLPRINITVLFLVYIISFFIGELNIDQLNMYFEMLPDFLQNKKGYINEEYVFKLKDEASMNSRYLIIYRILMKYIMLILVIYIYIQSKRNKININNFSWFSLALIFSSFSNLASQIPSGGRFSSLSNLFVISSVLFFYQQLNVKKLPTILKNVFVATMIFLIVVKARMGLDYVGFFMFIGNPVLNPFMDEKIPVIDFIKDIF